MDTILNAAAPAHFLAGLALFTLSGMMYSVLGRAVRRQSARWGLLAIVALALTEWVDLLPGGTARPLVGQSVRLLLELVALVATIELGRLCKAGPRAGLLPRWSYLVAAALTVAMVLLARLNLLEFALRLATIWQAGWLAANYCQRGKAFAAGRAGETRIQVIDPDRLATRAIIGSLAVYLLASCVAIPLLGALAALVAVAAAYLAFGPTADQTPRARLLWRCAWPFGFVLVAAAGCFALPAASVTETDVMLVELVETASEASAGEGVSADPSSPEANDAADAGPFDEDGVAADGDEFADRADAARTSALVHQAKRIGLGVSPIILFVLFVWGLSRLPFVH